MAQDAAPGDTTIDRLPVVEFAFPGPLRDRIVAAILAGEKTATSSLLQEYDDPDEPLPVVGGRGAVVDSAGERVGIVRVVDVRIVPLGDVPLDHALAEGEGYSSVSDWRAGHERFWTSEAMRAELGGDFVVSDELPVVLETFVLEGRAPQRAGHPEAQPES
ncbi:ASCH domain-containing protein [Herbiconiux sp. KACC 21604]|uniref:ASCH domain-containing protein n=1 Tax=unclassified Herbiconiux TaxID=2618217 RepID=UPI001492C609|nr:ASCH domain-containing protein [Herbiconiux sp. SALV-R1]WPO87570.1 ASCH domain-containing protein [Herbiconiux sp. KACC 21604]